uniref:Uncharacterized protein n=1 Tax=Manihot esculenta TaxID=3983 RepID=A0A2C9W2S0_MANES
MIISVLADGLTGNYASSPKNLHTKYASPKSLQDLFINMGTVPFEYHRNCSLLNKPSYTLSVTIHRHQIIVHFC